MKRIFTSKEVASEIRAFVKKEFNGYKFSVTSRTGYGVSVMLLDAPSEVRTEMGQSRKYNNVNHYYLKNCKAINSLGFEIFKKITDFAMALNCDYLMCQVGDLEKPFKVSQA